jgi:hypothetical protein
VVTVVVLSTNWSEEMGIQRRGSKTINVIFKVRKMLEMQKEAIRRNPYNPNR